MKLNKWLCVWVLTAIAVASTVGQVQPKTIIGPRMPTLSPDGKTVAFLYQGDIWRAPSAGGRAVRLTNDPALDCNPVFSPDGTWIAFCSWRGIRPNIFIIPSAGGDVRQLTYGGAVPSDWSPDGKSILFTATRDVPDSTIFEVNVKTSQLRKIISDFKGINFPSYSFDGSKVAFSRHGFQWYRFRYAGPSAAQVWTVDLKTNKRHEVTRGGVQHLYTRYMPDNKSVLCVTAGERTPTLNNLNEKPKKLVDSAKRTPNLWAFDAKGKGTQLTHFVGGTAKSPCIARKTGDIAFEYDGSLWVMKNGISKPVRLNIIASAETTPEIKTETIKNDVSEAHVSPDGKTVVFQSHLYLWSLPTSGAGEARKLTDYVGWNGDFCWSKDSRKIYFTSDREGALALYEMELQSLAVKKLLKRKGDIFRVSLTPDSKRLAFWVADEGFFTLPIEGGKPTRLIDYPTAGTSFGRDSETAVFSPNMQWLAFIGYGVFDDIDIRIMPANGGASVNVTKLNVKHSSPIWSPDGKYLFFLRDYDERGMFVLPLTKEDFAPSHADLKFEPLDSNAKFKIDFNEPDIRIRKHFEKPVVGAALGPDGMFYYIADKELWSVPYNGKQPKKLTSVKGVDGFELIPATRQALILKGSEMSVLNLDGGTVTPIPFTATIQKNSLLEHRASFYEFWRMLNRRLYDKNFHGRDWVALREKYEPMLEAVATPREFADLLMSMSGELDASHTGAKLKEGSDPPYASQLGFFYDYSYSGPGIRIKGVPEGSVGSFPKTKLNPGEYVLAINGKEVQLDESFYKILDELKGKDLVLTVNTRPDMNGARTVNYGPAGGGWDSYQEKVHRTRRLVDKLSKGRIAYVHIPSMDAGRASLLERQLFDYGIGKDAAIVDVRFNGGGYGAEKMAALFSTKPFGFYRARGAVVQNLPSPIWTKPVAVMINEFTFSDGEVFASVIRSDHIGALIGMPTAGYLIGMNGFGLRDGTFAGVGEDGMFHRDGTTVEGVGEPPDIQVDITPEEWEAGRDPQIEATVKHLLKTLDTGKKGKPLKAKG